MSGNIEQNADRFLAAWVLFKGCGQDRSSFGGDQLNMSPIAEQEQPQGVWSKLCLLDRVRGGAFGGPGIDVSAKGKEGCLPIVAKPRTQLMGAANTLDPANTGLKHPGSVLVRLHGPVRHTEGKGGDRQGISAGKFLGGGGSLKNIDPLNRVPMHLATGAWTQGCLFRFGKNGAGCSEAGRFEEGAPAWTLRSDF
jgi:hypothetical protein